MLILNNAWKKNEIIIPNWFGNLKSISKKGFFLSLIQLIITTPLFIYMLLAFILAFGGIVTPKIITIAVFVLTTIIVKSIGIIYSYSFDFKTTLMLGIPLLINKFRKKYIFLSGLFVALFFSINGFSNYFLKETISFQFNEISLVLAGVMYTVIEIGIFVFAIKILNKGVK